MKAIAAMRGQGGFTLTELIVSIGVTLVVILAGVVTYLGTIHSWEGTASLTRIQREASFAMEVMVRDIRDASSCDISAAGDSLTVYFWTGTVDSVIAVYYLDDQDRLIDMDGTVLVTEVDSLGFSAAGSTVNIDVLLKDEMETPEASQDDQAVLISSTVACRN
jgi:type II secretory pathway pseudopilin PulG